MLSYILRRIVMMVPVLITIGAITFAIVHLTPGDPTTAILGDDATAQQREQLRESLGLDQPLVVQFFTWFYGLLLFDFGDSLYLGIPVTEALASRAAPSLLLATYSLILALLVGIPTGVLAAQFRNGFIDRVLVTGTVGLATIPNFFFGIMMILFFGVHLGWFPTGGYVSPLQDPIGHIRAMAMPVLVLGMSITGFSRVLRSSMLDVLNSEFILAATARGVRRQTILVKHALRNAALPCLTVIGISFGALLGGTVVIEYVFNINGFGALIVQSIGRRDFPMIQGGVMLAALAFVLVNLVVDILYVYLDPRIQYVNN